MKTKAVINQSIFEKFIGIDWSGAKNPKNLRVAVCLPGESVPKLEGKYWRREELVPWIINEVKERRILVGFDFAFAYPYGDKKAYFPGHPQSPASASALWQTVDNICQREPDFYGGPLYQDRNRKFSDYFCYLNGARRHYVDRLRKTEKICKEHYNTRPTCVFKCVGPDQVGSGSAAGMRVLYRLATNHKNKISIWPFHSVSKSKSTLVEIFPRLFFAIAGEDSLNSVLKYYNSRPVMENIAQYSKDEIDAIISAAALRDLSSRAGVWHPQSLDEETRRFEGWIFGCTQ